MQAAEPPEQPVLLAAPSKSPGQKGKPYHAPIAPELEDELHLYVGKGLALIEQEADRAPAQIVNGIAEYLDSIGDGRRKRLPDMGEVALALACVYGQQICRALGWGWAHLRRTRAPGIVVISPDCRHATGPRAIVDRALDAGQGGVLLSHFQGLERDELPHVAPGVYARV